MIRRYFIVVRRNLQVISNIVFGLVVLLWGAEVRALHRQFGDRVILGGDMPIGDYFRALWMSDIQVSTAGHESFGVATVEAMYTENACLLPRRGSYPEICGGRSDVLYDSVGELEHRISSLVTRPEQLRAVGKELAEKAREYGPATVVPRIVDAVEEALGGDTGPSVAGRKPRHPAARP